ncbi:hypothetical protein NC651_031590 [Populus alba x Populus x berolinensis]|nr:hypothetical protein NC651_031590 [Populus alba x Populus x berolinensis]
MDNYFFVESDGPVKRFHEMKTEWGFDQLLSLETFNDASNDDFCYPTNWQMGITFYAFTAGGRSWRIQVYPKGNAEAKGDSLSVFLELVDGDKLPLKKTVWAEYKLRVLDQRRDKHVEKNSFTLVNLLQSYTWFPQVHATGRSP